MTWSVLARRRTSSTWRTTSTTTTSTTSSAAKTRSACRSASGPSTSWRSPRERSTRTRPPSTRSSPGSRSRTSIPSEESFSLLSSDYFRGNPNFWFLSSAKNIEQQIQLWPHFRHGQQSNFGAHVSVEFASILKANHYLRVSCTEWFKRGCWDSYHCLTDYWACLKLAVTLNYGY